MNFHRLYLIGFLVLLTLALIDSVYGYYRANAGLDIPPENRTRFVEVLVAVDGTRSMSDANFAAAKEIVARRLVPFIGIGDRLTCFSIGPRYGISNVVFGATFEEQPPQLPEVVSRRVVNSLSHLRSNPNNVTSAQGFRQALPLIQPLFKDVPTIHAFWNDKLAKMSRPRYDGTAIRALLEGIEAEFETGSKDQTDRWIVIVGDLVEEPPRGSRLAESAANADALQGVNVVLIYPHESERDYERIKASWKTYFGDIDVKVYPFSKIRTQQFILPPNPFFGLETYRVKTAWDYIRPCIGPELIGFGLFCGPLICAFLLKKRADRVSPQGSPALTP
jgi:hypothetical protein